MKHFWVMTIMVFCLLPVARAQQEADERYVTIYNLIQQADNLASSGQSTDALSTYTDAQGRLAKFQKMYPSWDPSIINFRLDDLNKKIADLQIQLAPKQVPAQTPVNTADAEAARLQAQLAVEQQQVQSAQAENQALQAKLKEALATQPAVIDASELTAAQDQIRELMKQNDLMKATPAGTTETVTDTNQINALRQQLAAAMKKYNDEQARAQTLVKENSSLQQSIAKTGTDAQSLDVISSENERLRTQLAQLQKASDSAAAAGELAAKLNDARTQVANLQASAALASLEKAGLENKVRKLSAQLTESAANFDGRVHDLTEQRDDLLKQLSDANSKNSHRQVSDVASQITELNNEVNVLRSRIAVDESKAIPYTDEELALFKQAAPEVETVQKSITQMPAGTANLVASAQRHFSNHEFDQAEADYQKILDRDQNNGLALANLATIELQENKFDDAERHIKAALAQSPEDAYNLSTLGYLKFRQEKYDEAMDALSHAVRIDPNNPETQNYLGVTLSHKGLRMQAETALRRALQLDPNYAPAHNNIAVIYLSQTPPLPQLARWHYQKALEAGQPPNAELEKMLADKGAPMPPSVPNPQ